MNYAKLLVFCAVLVAGCTQDLSLTLPPDAQLKLSSHVHGSPTETCSIAHGSPQYQALEKWLNQNRGGWQTTPATYVPGKVVSGPDFTLNFIGSLVIANFAGGQYSHSIVPTDYGFLQCK